MLRSSDTIFTHYWFNYTRHVARCIACARPSAMFKKHCILFMKCITFRQDNKVRYHDHVLPRKWQFMDIIILSLETLQNCAAQGREIIFLAQYVDIRPAWAANGVFHRRSQCIIYIYIYTCMWFWRKIDLDLPHRVGTAIRQSAPIITCKDKGKGRYVWFHSRMTPTFRDTEGIQICVYQRFSITYFGLISQHLQTEAGFSDAPLCGISWYLMYRIILTCLWWNNLFS